MTTWKGLLDFGLSTTTVMRHQYIYAETKRQSDTLTNTPNLERYTGQKQLDAVMKVFVVLAVAVLSGKLQAFCFGFLSVFLLFYWAIWTKSNITPISILGQDCSVDYLCFHKMFK